MFGKIQMSKASQKVTYKHKYIHQMFDGTEREFHNKDESEEFFILNRLDIKAIHVIAWPAEI